MLTLIFFVLLIPSLTVGITLGVWYWFNRETEKAVEIKRVLIELGNDISKLIKDMKGLSHFLSEVAQPLLSPAAIDVESEHVNDEIKVEEEKEVDMMVGLTKKIEGTQISESLDKEPEVKNEKIEVGAEVPDDTKFLEVVEEVMDEVEIFTELIQKEDNVSRLEAALKEWKSKGNERLALACAVAIEDLKAKQDGKQELLNLWSDEELQMEEDIAS